MKALTSLEELTPDRLTEILRNEGHLVSGYVESIDITSSTPTVNSTVVFLDVAYSSTTSAVLPTKLFFKFASPETSADDEMVPLSELSYYRKVAPRTAPRPSHDILAVQVDADTRQFHLLMADVSDTHFLQSSGLPSTKAAHERFFGVLATFHAQWWDHPDLGTEIGQMPKAGDQGLDIERTHETVNTCAGLMGEYLTPARRRTYHRILDAIPELKDLKGRTRLTESGNLTVVHGDAHYGNIFFPRDPETHDPFLIDWQDWRVHVGTNDLAKQIMLSWYPERRQVVEESLVKHYHRTLVEDGVTGYDWEDCWHDYRMSALRMMLIPLYTSPGREGMCYHMMQQSFLNFEDLGLEDLL